MDSTTTEHPQPATPRLWSVEAAADLLDVSTREVWRMIRNGQLTRVRLSDRKTRVRDDELAKLVAAAQERSAQ